MAAGVVPESALARAAGLEVSERGGVVVDDHQRTSDPHVFAVGDVAVKRDAVSGDAVLVPLAQTANRHGRLVADVITGRPVTRQARARHGHRRRLRPDRRRHRLEREAAARRRPRRPRHPHPPQRPRRLLPRRGADARSSWSSTPATDEILGAQGVGGSGVDKRIDVIATAMRGGLRASDLADLELTYAPQYGSAKDPVNMLGMIAENMVTGVTRTIQWHEVEAEVARRVHAGRRTHRRGVRRRHRSPTAVNIPVDELRERHAELPAGPHRGHLRRRPAGPHRRPGSSASSATTTWSTSTAATAPSCRPSSCAAAATCSGPPGRSSPRSADPPHPHEAPVIRPAGSTTGRGR